MKQNRICPVCGEDCRKVALVALVYTFEPVNEELVETAWHKSCFVSTKRANFAKDSVQKTLVDEQLLLELKTGVLEAIGGEDGLDGADGIYLLSGINLALGLPVDDHTLPTST